MRDKIMIAARAAGRDPDDITYCYHLQVNLDPDAQPEPGVLTGPTAKIAEELVGFGKLGFTAFSVTPVGPDRAAELERVATEIIPAVA
jgi:hypothetical protein